MDSTVGPFPRGRYRAVASRWLERRLMAHPGSDGVAAGIGPVTEMVQTYSVGDGNRALEAVGLAVATVSI